MILVHFIEVLAFTFKSLDSAELGASLIHVLPLKGTNFLFNLCPIIDFMAVIPLQKCCDTIQADSGFRVIIAGEVCFAIAVLISAIDMSLKSLCAQMKQYYPSILTQLVPDRSLYPSHLHLEWTAKVTCSGLNIEIAVAIRWELTIEGSAVAAFFVLVIAL